MLSHRRGWAGLDLWFRRCNIPPPAQHRHLCHPCKRASHVVHGTDGINAQLPQHGTAPHAQQSRVAALREQQAIATPEKSDQHSQGQPYPGQHAQQQLEQQQNQGNAKEGQHVGRLRRRPARGGRGTKAGSVQADPAERGQQADSDPDMPKQSVQAMQHVQQQGSTAAAGQGRRGGRAAPTRHSMRRLRGGEGFSGDGEEQEGGVRTVSRKGQRLALAGPQNPGGASSPPTPCLDGRATLGGDEAGADPASAGGLLDPNTPQLQGCNDRGVQGGPGGGVGNDTSAAATNSGGSKKGGSEAGSGRRTGSPTRRRREGGHSGRSKTVRGSIGSSKHQPRKAGGGGSSGGGGGGGTPPPTWYASAEALALLRGIGVKEEAVARVVAEAAPHIPSDRGSQLDRAGVEAACEFLIQAVGVPAGKLAGVVEGAPEVLAVGVEELGGRVQLLRTLWQGRRANLAAAVQERPEVLCRAFFSQLGPSLDALTSLGFSRDQACGAVARYPPLVLQRRYELAAALRQAGAAPGESPPQVYTLLAKYPRLLSKEGCPELRPALRVLRECGLEGEHALHALADWPMLARMPVQRVRGAVNILRSNGFKEGDVAAVLRGFPQIAGVDVRRIKTVLSLLRAAGIPYQRAVQYPRVFLHDPANYTGPRLAYLKAHQLGRAEELQLVSILSRSDAEFAEARGNIPLEEYLLFKDRWLALYGHRFGLTPEQADPMRRRLREQLAEEVTGSLFSTIPWDSL